MVDLPCSSRHAGADRATLAWHLVIRRHFHLVCVNRYFFRRELYRCIANTARVVIPQGCNDVNPGRANCDNDRGSIFTSNASSTWSTQRLTNDGLFSLETLEEGFLGLSGNAYYGFDVLTLGVLGSGLPSLPDQLIAGIATNSFWYLC